MMKCFMTKEQIDEQIRVIREATKMASGSKESALAFLINAGIVKPAKRIVSEKH